MFNSSYKTRDDRHPASATALSTLAIGAAFAAFFAPAAAATSPLIYVSDWDTNAVHVFDLYTGASRGTVIPPRDRGGNALAGMTLGPDGAIYLTDFATDEVRRYNADTGAFLGTFISAGEAGINNATDLTFAPDGSLLIANGDGGGVLRFSSVGAFQNVLIPAANCGSPRFIALAGDRKQTLLVTDHHSDIIHRYDTATGAWIGALECCAPSGQGIAIAATGEVLVASWQQETIERFSAATGAYLGTLISNVRANAIAIGPDGYLYVCEAARHVIERYDPLTGQLLLTIGTGELDDPWQLAFRTDVPGCRADFDNNGQADFFDYLEFVDAFDSQHPSADFDHNNTIDFFDYLEFIQAFAAGC
jgi:streptogramin lyase